MTLDKEDLDAIDAVVRKHEPDGSISALIAFLFILFIFGFFKGCGY